MKLIARPLRAALAEVIQLASEELLVAAPYIKTVEVNWMCDLLAHSSGEKNCTIRVLTDIRSDSVLSGSLDLEALNIFYQRGNRAEVVSLPRLHAKVYIADNRRALLTSANLTPAGLDHNYEYGVCLEDSALVTKVRNDLEAYACLGSILDEVDLESLLDVAQNLKDEYKQLTKSVNHSLKARFTRTLRQAHIKFLSAQVGKRSAQGLFAEAILHALSQGPLTTRQLHPSVQSLLPDLCDDSVELIINGERFGKRWKHAVRNAQQYLKRSGRIVFHGGRWLIATK